MRKLSQCWARQVNLLALQPAHLLSMIERRASTKELPLPQEEKLAKTCLNLGIANIKSALKKLNLPGGGAKMIGRIRSIDSFRRVCDAAIPNWRICDECGNRSLPYRNWASDWCGFDWRWLLADRYARQQEIEFDQRRFARFVNDASFRNHHANNGP